MLARRHLKGMQLNIQRILIAVLIVIGPAAEAQAISWPQELSAEGGAVVLIYQPQVESFAGNSIEGRAAVSVKTPASNNIPVFGAIWIKARIDTDRDTRTAIIRDIDVGEVRFADVSDLDKQILAKFIESQVEGASFTISVDQLLADLDAGGGRLVGRRP